MLSAFGSWWSTSSLAKGAWLCATLRSGSISSIRPTSGPPSSYLPASIYHKATMKPKERNLTMRTPYTAVNGKESGGSTWNLEDYAGYAVCDPRGHKLGRAEKLFLNGRGEPEYVRVKLGLFGIKTVLIPVQTVAVDEERRALVLQ